MEREYLPLQHQHQERDWTRIAALASSLRSIRHLSIDFSVENHLRKDESGFFLFTNSECCLHTRDFRLEQILADCLDVITKHAHVLETFTLHLVSNVCSPSCGADYLAHILDDVANEDTPLQLALARLARKVCDRFSIVSNIYEGGYEWLRGAIAPEEQWTVEGCRVWPGLKLSEKELGFHGLRVGDSYATRAWYFWPERSRSRVRDWRDVEGGAKRGNEEVGR